MQRLPRNAAILLQPVTIGYMAFHNVAMLPANVLANVSLFSAGRLAAAFDCASETLDCEQDPATGQWVWASLAPTVVPG